MKNLPTINQLNKALLKNPWDFSNEILYNLCKDNFLHNQHDIILTKVLFIGRIYAAAVERRKTKKTDINDNFYFDKVEPAFRESKLDEHLKRLMEVKSITSDKIPLILQTHYYLQRVLNRITGLNKRSFCSKYLHFHLPDLFFIYDSRALMALRNFITKVPKEFISVLQTKKIDMEYARFFCMCYQLKKQIEFKFDTTITTRQFDHILIEVANKIMVKKQMKLY
ncbi:hypothetical protein ACFLSY_10440 [Bacteroidota bacterium]